MRILYLIIFLLSICGNEIVLEYVMLNGHDLTYFELSPEDQSEMELEDLFEDDYFMSDIAYHHQGNYFSSLSVSKESNLRSTPYLEIHCPPPES